MHYTVQVVSAVLLAAALAQAQDPQQSWNNLRILRVGERIQVVEQNLRSHAGAFLSFSEETITFQSGNVPVMVQRRDVFRVSAPRRSKRLRNTLVGLGIGAGFGFVLGMADCERATDMNCKASDRAVVGAAVALAYGGIGAGVGALIPQRTTIYRAERHRTQTTP